MFADVAGSTGSGTISCGGEFTGASVGLVCSIAGAGAERTGSGSSLVSIVEDGDGGAGSGAWTCGTNGGVGASLDSFGDGGETVVGSGARAACCIGGGA